MGVLAMFGSILLLFFLPWLDTSPVRSGHYRPLFRKFFWYGLIPTMVVLFYCGGAPAEEPYVMLSQIASLYYFAHFLIILPIVLLGATVLTALLPGGPAIIWGATCVWLYFEGRVGATIALALYGALIVSTVDNFLRPILISGSTRIPFILVFLGVLGGLASLGLLGMFVGPVLLAVGFGLLAEFPDRFAPRSPGE